MGYDVCNIEKAKGDGLHLAQHIERSIYKTEKGESGEKIVRVMDYTPGNVTKNKTHLNKEYIPTDDKTLFERVNDRIHEALGDKKIRKDQVRYFSIVVSASHEDMVKIQEDGNLDLWCRMNTEWAQNFFGKDNVVGATLHLDEKTPHMHIPVVPIVSGETRKRKLKDSKGEGEARKYKKDLSRLRLSCDDMLSKEILKKMQTSHFETVAKPFGIKRGIEGSDAKHQTTQEYYANLVREATEKLEALNKTISKKDDELIKKNTQIEELNDSLNEVKKQNAEVKKELKENALEIIDSGILDIKDEGKSKEMRELIESDPQNETLSQNVKTVVDGIKDAAHAAIEKIEDMSAMESEIKHNIKSEAIDILDSNILDMNGEGISKNIKTLFENDLQNERVIENFNLVTCGLHEVADTLNNKISESQEEMKKQTLEIIDSGILDIKEEGRSKEIRELIEADTHNENLAKNFNTVVDGMKDSVQTSIELSETKTQLNQDLRKQVIDIMNSGILNQNTTNEVRIRIQNDPKDENIADTAIFAISKAVEAGKSIEEKNSKIKSVTVALTEARERQISSSLKLAGTTKADVMKTEIVHAIDKKLENKQTISNQMVHSFAILVKKLDFRPSEIIADYIANTIDQRTEERMQRLRTRFGMEDNSSKNDICIEVKKLAKEFDNRNVYSHENNVIENYVPDVTFRILSNELKKQLDTLAEKAASDPTIDKKLEDVATFLKVDMIQAVSDAIENKAKDLDEKVEKIDSFNEGMASIYKEIETTSSELSKNESALEKVKKELSAYQHEKTFLDSIQETKSTIDSAKISETPSIEYPNIPFDNWKIESKRKGGLLSADKEDFFLVPVSFKERYEKVLDLCDEKNRSSIVNHTNDAVEGCKNDFYAHINEKWKDIKTEVKQVTEVEPNEQDLEKAKESASFYKKLASVYRKHPEIAEKMTDEKENELFTKGQTVAKVIKDTIVEPFILLYNKLSPKIICEKAKNFAKIIFGEKPEKAKDIELKKKMEETGEAPVNYKYDKEKDSFVYEFHKDIVEQKAQDFSEKQGLRRGKGMGI